MPFPSALSTCLVLFQLSTNRWLSAVCVSAVSPSAVCLFPNDVISSLGAVSLDSSVVCFRLFECASPPSLPVGWWMILVKRSNQSESRVSIQFSRSTLPLIYWICLHISNFFRSYFLEIVKWFHLFIHISCIPSSLWSHDFPTLLFSTRFFLLVSHKATRTSTPITIHLTFFSIRLFLILTLSRLCVFVPVLCNRTALVSPVLPRCSRLSQSQFT